MTNPPTTSKETLADDLQSRAVCNTNHPAEAVAALMRAAAKILHPVFGVAGSCNLLRKAMDDTEADLIAIHGQQPGEVAQ